MFSFDEMLLENEKVLKNVKLHWTNFVYVSFLGVVTFILIAMVAASYFFSIKVPFFMIIIVIIFLYLFLCNLNRLCAKKYIITNKRIVSLNRRNKNDIKELENLKIESINVRKSVFGFIFGYATVCFVGKDVVIEFENIANPKEIKDFVELNMGIK
ncbi:MAG: PH domain-containing protein [Alphaproteobacteria bacterium]|nr:PH domain-containing protein [Alphaproteobacteria bacterium]